MKTSEDESLTVLGRVLASNYVDFSLATLVFYEHAITFQREVILIWRRRFSIPSLLFICIRYVLLCNAIVSLAIDLSWGISRYALCFVGLLVELVINALASCSALQRINEVYIVLIYLTSAAFIALRIYALWGRDLRLFIAIFLLNIIPAITNIICFTGDRPKIYTFPNVISQCNLEIVMSPAMHERAVQATRFPMIIADMLVVCLTWAKTVGQFTRARKFHLETPLSTLFLQDGTLYFLVLMVLNIAQVVLEAKNISPISPFIYTLTPILLSRFLLHLRCVNEPHTEVTWRLSAHLQFKIPSNFAGNMDQSLILGEESNLLDDDCVQSDMHVHI